MRWNCFKSNSKNKGRKSKNKERDVEGHTEGKDDSPPTGQTNQDERLISKQKELKPRDLEEEHLDQICALLEKKDSTTFSWCGLVDHVFDDPKKRSDLKKDLENLGANFGLLFLEALETRIVSIKDFKKHATNHKMLLDHLSQNFADEELCLSELIRVQLVEIARFLNNDTPGLCNWKYYAGKFEFQDTEIMSIENEGSSRKTSPSKALINEELPESFSLYHLRQSFGVPRERNLWQIKIDEITKTILNQEPE